MWPSARAAASRASGWSLSASTCRIWSSTGSGARSQILIELLQQHGQIVGGKRGGRRRVGGIPIFGLGVSGIKRGQGHDRKLGCAEGRVEALINRVAFPAALRALRGKHGLDGHGEVRVGLRTMASLGQGEHGIVGNEIGGLGLLVERIRPAALGRLILVKLLDQGVDLRGILFVIDLRQEHDLPAQVDHVLRLVRHGKPLDVVALGNPIPVVRFGEDQVEGVPALLRDLEGAHLRLAAVGLIAGHHGHALVVNLEESRVRHIEVLARLVVRDVLLKRMHDERQAAGLGTRGVDHAHPVGARLAVKRAGVVVDAVGDELQAGALGGRIAVLHGPQVAAGGELRGMAGDAELRLGVLHGGAQGNGAAARSVGEPCVAHVDEEIHAGAHGLVRVLAGRHVVLIGVQLVGRMVRGYAHIIFLAGLENAGAEFVKSGIVLRSFNLIREFALVVGNHIRLAVRVFAHLEDVHVQGHVAIGHVQHEVDQLGLFPAKGKVEPLETLQHGVVGVFVFRWGVGALVVPAEDGLAQLKRLRVLPGAVGRGRNDAALQVRSAAGQRSRGSQNLFHGGANLRRTHARGRGEAHRDRARGARAEREVEVQVGSVQPLRLDLALRIVDGHLHRIVALELGKVLDVHRERIHGAGAGGAQLDFAHRRGRGLIGMDGTAKVEGNGNNANGDGERHNRQTHNASTSRGELHDRNLGLKWTFGNGEKRTH